GPARPPEPPRDHGSAAAPTDPRRDRRPAPRASERRPARGDRGRGGGRRGRRRSGLGDSARWSPPREGGQQGSGRGGTMQQDAVAMTLTIPYPPEVLWALQKNPDEFEAEARLLLSLKLYETGKLTTGLAAE